MGINNKETIFELHNYLKNEQREVGTRALPVCNNNVDKVECAHKGWTKNIEEFFLMFIYDSVYEK